jgi:hypothetical protein
MGKKPSLWLSGLLLSSLAATGCASCGDCFGSKGTTTPYLAAGGGAGPGAQTAGWNRTPTQTQVTGTAATSPMGGTNVGRPGTYGTPVGGTAAGFGAGPGQYSTVPQQRMAEKPFIPAETGQPVAAGARMMDEPPPPDPVVFPAGAARGGLPSELPPLPREADEGPGGVGGPPMGPVPPPALKVEPSAPDGPSFGGPVPPGTEPPAPSGGRQPPPILPSASPPN